MLEDATRSLWKAGLVLARVQPGADVVWPQGIHDPVIQLLARSEACAAAVQAVVSRWHGQVTPLPAEAMHGLWVLPGTTRPTRGTLSWLVGVLPTSEFTANPEQLAPMAAAAEVCPDAIRILLKHSPTPGAVELQRLRLLVTLAVKPLMGPQYSESLAAAEALLAAIELVDPETASHGRRVGALSERLAQEAELPAEVVRDAFVAGLVHDAGKLTIGRALLLKPGRLTPPERAQVEEHAAAGAALVARVAALAHLTGVVAHHHERWDGAGYPIGLVGESIPLVSRVIAVADAFDAMVENRCYDHPREEREAAEEILRCGGSQFDPTLASIFVRVVAPSVDGALSRGQTPTLRAVA